MPEIEGEFKAPRMTYTCSTDSYQGRDKVEYWQAALQDVCGEFRTHFVEKNSFTGSISSRNVGGIDIARISSNAERITRSRKQVANASDDYCFLIAQISGCSMMRQNGQEALLEKNDVTLIDSGRPSDFCFDGSFEQLSVHLPRKTIENKLRDKNIPCALQIPGKDGLGSILTNFMARLYDEADHFSPTQGAGLREAIFDLATAAILADTPLTSDPAISQATLSQIGHIQNFILARLPDPTLTPSSVAAAYGISTRHLHRMFNRVGTSVGEWIRLQRLSKCREDLANQRFAGHGIIQIAFHWGFNDASHFSRAFRAEFNISPREYRLQESARRAQEMR